MAKRVVRAQVRPKSPSSRQRDDKVHEGGPLPRGILSRIRLRLESLSRAERRVAREVLDEPDQVVRLTIAEVAARSAVSEGTVVRFCTSVGCDGYHTLKLQLAADLSERMREIPTDINSSDGTDVDSIATTVFLGDVQALE